MSAADALASPSNTNMTPHIDRPPPSVRLKYLHQFRPRHSENFNIYYTLYCEDILGVFLSQIALGEVRKFERLSHLVTDA